MSKGKLYRQAVVDMLQKNMIPPLNSVWVDAYTHKTELGVAGTITTRIDSSNNYFVTVFE
jgi:hypothetical protein